MTCIRGRFISRFVISLIVFCLVWLGHDGARVGAGQPAVKSIEAVFVTCRTERGVFSRQLPEAEAAKLRLKMDAEDGKELAATVLHSGRTNSPAQSRFTLVATPQLDAVPQAKAAVERALAKWDGVFESLSPITVRVDFGTALFGGQFPSPSTVAVTSVFLYPAFYPALSGLLRDRAFDAQQQSLYDAFPPDVLVTEVGSAERILMPVPLARVTGVFVGGGNDSFTIGFNSNNSFDFDPSDGIDADKLDFEALALREVGRALGFVSGAGGAEVLFDTQSSIPPPQTQTMWDVFRFRGQVSFADFGSAVRAQLSGGDQVFFAGDQYLPLSTGRSDGKGGDGRPAGHWKDDELTGQYIGIMDPTYAPGEQGGLTANDLKALDYFGHTVIPQAPVIEVLSNDDNSREETLALDGAMAVTRLLPGRYPCRVQSVRVQLPPAANGSSPVGQQMRLVIFADPARTGRPPANPPLLLDRTIKIPALPQNRMLEVMLPNGPAINAGDLYIGWQTPAGVLLAGDANVTQQRSFVTADNGATFQPLLTGSQRPVNLIARAVATAAYGDPAVPRIASLSPASIAPGDTNVKLFVYGQNFTGLDVEGFREHSVVRWNGREKYTEFINGSLLIASLDDVDVASAGVGRVTVFTNVGFSESVESASFEIAIVPTRPAPALASLTPPGGPVGGEGLSLSLKGRNFTPDSVVRWNGSVRRPDFISSVELSLPVSKADLANAGNVEVVVSTPAPGGGASNKAIFAVTPCRYTLSATDYPLAINGGSQGVLVATESYCQWTARSDVPWITIPGLNSGVGRGFLSYAIDDNYAANGRSGALIVGDTKLNIRQSGFAKFVSSASFTAPLAPESIATVFSLGLGNSINIASASPLPTKLDGLEVKVRSALGVERVAPLFFSSPEQINFQVPAGIGFGNATIFVNGPNSNRTLNYGTVQIASVAPGFFTVNASGSGVAAAVALRVKADGTQSYEPVAVFDPALNRVVARPIDLGAEGEKVFLLMFGTGIRGRSALTGVGVKIGGVDSAVSFAGAQTDFVGLDQINVQLPAALRGRGEVTINCTVDGRAANAVTVTVK